MSSRWTASGREVDPRWAGPAPIPRVDLRCHHRPENRRVARIEFPAAPPGSRFRTTPRPPRAGLPYGRPPAVEGTPAPRDPRSPHGSQGYDIRTRWRDQVPEVLPPRLQRVALFVEILVPIVNPGHGTVGMVEHASDDKA